MSLPTLLFALSPLLILPLIIVPAAVAVYGRRVWLPTLLYCLLMGAALSAVFLLVLTVLLPPEAL